MNDAHKPVEPRPATSKRLLPFILASLIGSVLLAIVGWVAGATYGGNYATDFVFNGLRGYEATGQIGAIIGFAGGVLLGALLIYLLSLRHRKP